MKFTFEDKGETLLITLELTESDAKNVGGFLKGLIETLTLLALKQKSKAK